MRLVVLGATGKSGQVLVSQALAADHDVIALVRNPAKMQLQHERLKVEKADIFSTSSMSPHMNGCDAVLSCLGSAYSYFSVITFYEDSIKCIVQAMRDAGVSRLVCITSMFTVLDDESPWIARWILHPWIGRQLDSMSVMEKFLFEQEDINYTIVRPPGLTNFEFTGRPVQAEEGQYISTSPWRYHMPRADVTNYMLSLLVDQQWDRKDVAIIL